MAIYTKGERSIVNIDSIDSAHRNIAELFQAIIKLINEEASVDKVHETFQQLAKVMKDHFVIEERALHSLGASEEVADHIVRHIKNHKFFCDTLTYAEDKFAKEASSKEIPNIVELIPTQYIEELKDLDAEMAELFSKYGHPSGMNHHD